MHKEYFKFSCAHFLIFPDGSKERLHGHNYQVSVEIAGSLTDRGLVIDFKRAKPVIREIVDWLDEHFLLPGENPDLTYTEREDGHLEWSYHGCHYCAPRDEVIILPIDNSSVENLATYLGRRIQDDIRSQFGADKIERLRVLISETSGQHGVYEFQNDDNKPTKGNLSFRLRCWYPLTKISHAS